MLLHVIFFLLLKEQVEFIVINFYFNSKVKKITAFFLLLLFSFNWFAYRFVIDYAQFQNNLDLEKLFDNELYDEARLVELKVAMNLPYQTSRPGYERVDGEIEVEGILYKYVKRKVVNDTLYLMCLPNTQKMKLETTKNDFFKRANLPDQSIPLNAGDSGWSVFKHLQNMTDESSLQIHILFPDTDCETAWFDGIAGAIQNNLQQAIEQPPEC